MNTIVKFLTIVLAFVNVVVGWAQTDVSKAPSFSNTKGVSSLECDYIVSQDTTGLTVAVGSKVFTTVQDAIDAVPDFRKQITRIYICKGVYKEKIVIAPSKQHIALYGEQGTVLTYDDYAGKPNVFGENKGTSGSSSIYIYASDFYAENITFENSSGPVGQAVACFVAGDRVHFCKCRFLGFQDTLYTWGRNSRQYYEECYVEGTVDFIFGASTAIFDRCQIHSKKAGYVTAPSTPQETPYGYVFYECQLTAEDGLEGNVFLSRPWRPYGKAVFVKCQLGKHIHPKGWNNWGKVSNEQTAYYAEYQNVGPGAFVDKRADWGHQLDNLEKYLMEDILAGHDGWSPTNVK